MTLDFLEIDFGTSYFLWNSLTPFKVNRLYLRDRLGPVRQDVLKYSLQGLAKFVRIMPQHQFPGSLFLGRKLLQKSRTDEIIFN